MSKTEENLNTHDSDIGYFVEVNLNYPDKIKEKTKDFPFAPENKICNRNDFSDYMKKIKPDTYTQTRKILCHWSDKKNYLIQYRVLKFYVRHGMVVEIFYDIVSFKQSKWLEKYISFITQKLNKAKNEFERKFYKLPKFSIYGKTMENVRSRIRLELFEKDDITKFIKQQ